MLHCAFRLVAREEECAAYVEMWKRRLTAKVHRRERQMTICLGAFFQILLSS